MTKRSWERDKSKSLGRKGKTLKDEDERLSKDAAAKFLERSRAKATSTKVNA